MLKKEEIYSNIKNYLSNTYIENALNCRYLNTENELFIISRDELKTISDLDDYFAILIKERTRNVPGGCLNKYITTIAYQLEKQPLLLLSLPLWKIDKNILRQYLSNYDRIIERINILQSEANNIYRKFELNPHKITPEEIKKLSVFFSYSIPYADEKMFRAQEILAKHLLNNPKDTKYNYEISMFLIKFFGYKKIREEKLENSKIIICKLPSSTLGESSSNYVIINKKLLQLVKMENNFLEDKFGQNMNNQNNDRYQTYEDYFSKEKPSYEMLGILHTLYHEIRHQKQRMQNKENLQNDLSYYYAAFKLINEGSKIDYEINYKCYEIEKDANLKAWEEIEKLIKTYIENRNTPIIMRNILNHKLKEELEQITGIRKTREYKTYISNDLLIKYIDEKFRNNPSLLKKEFKQFLNFYNYDGTPKRVIEILNQSSIYNFKEFFFGQVCYRRKIFGNNITRSELNNLSLKETQNIINNLKILMNINQSKLNKICDRVKKYNENSQDITENIKNYYNFAIYISNITSEILQLNPNLKNVLSIKNSLESINDNIELINKNSIVIKVINNNNVISKIGRR